MMDLNAIPAVRAWFDSITESRTIDFDKPYFLCNESHQDEIIQTIAAKVLASDSASQRPTPAQHSVHIGFAAQFNYDVIAITHPTYALICDINSKMIEYYHNLEHCVRAFPDRRAFLHAILEVIDPVDQENFSHELNRPNSWLSTDEKYAFIRSMYLSDRICHKCLNAAGEELEAFARRMPDDVHVDTVYASNIFEWLENSEFEIRDQFIKNMTALIRPGTHFIDARYLTRNHDNSGPPLRINSAIPNYAEEKQRHRRCTLRR